jgi:hypothetical protein
MRAILKTSTPRPVYHLAEEDEGGFVQFIVTFTVQKYLCAFTVHDVTGGWDAETHEPLGVEPYCRGHIKWDGCSHVWFGAEQDDGKPDGYLHLCGAAFWADHVQLMEWLYRQSAELIGKTFDPSQRWPDDRGQDRDPGGGPAGEKAIGRNSPAPLDRPPPPPPPPPKLLNL